MPQPERETIAAAIECLEHFRTRIGMHIGHANVNWASRYLDGFRRGLQVSGIKFVQDAWWKVQRKRGWKIEASGPVSQMESKGLDVQAIIWELTGENCRGRHP